MATAEQISLAGSFALYDELHKDVNLLEVTPSIAHILRSLPKLNRFNGQTALPYDVAMHSVQCVTAARDVYGMKKAHQQLAVLMHDAAEAYISDIPRPLKRAYFKEAPELEAELMQRIFDEIFEIHPVHMEEIKSHQFQLMLSELDLRMAVTEYDKLSEVEIMPEVPRLNPPRDFYVTDWRKSTYQFAKTLLHLTTRPLDGAPRFKDPGAFKEQARTIIAGVKGSGKYFL